MASSISDQRRQNSDWRETTRSVEVVEDTDAPSPDTRFRSAASVLNSLGAPLLSEFRRTVRSRYAAGNPRFRCAKCEAAVYVSLAGAGAPLGRDGRRAFFGHHPGTASNCPWGSTGENPREIDRQRYGGVQEGAQHRRLKVQLSIMLAADTIFGDISVERVISRPPLWRKPDVSAVRGEQLSAFDIQLATTQLPEIVAREAFYEHHGIAYVWLVDVLDMPKLARQAFQDIYWHNDGQVFALDDVVKERTLETGILHLCCLVAAPRLEPSGARTVWEKRLVARSDIEWDTPSRRPKLRDTNFKDLFRARIMTPFVDARRRLVHAVGAASYSARQIAEGAWNEIAAATSAPNWAAADQDEAFKALGVLATAAAGKKMDASRYTTDHLTAMFNQFLEQHGCRGWTTALVQIAEAHGHGSLLGAVSTRRKVDRNLSEPHPDFGRRYAAILDVVFPDSSMARLTGPPDTILDG